MINPFPSEILQPADLIHRANMISFTLHENNAEEDTDGRTKGYKQATNQDLIPTSWSWNQQSLSYERFLPMKVYHTIETTSSLREVVQSTFFIDNRYLISIDAAFVASIFTRNGDAVRMFETPVTKLVKESDFIQLTSFQQFFFDVYTDQGQIINERGFSKLTDFIAANFEWKTTLEDERLSIFAIILRFTFHEKEDFEPINEEFQIGDLMFEFITDESGFDSDEQQP